MFPTRTRPLNLPLEKISDVRYNIKRVAAPRSDLADPYTKRDNICKRCPTTNRTSFIMRLFILSPPFRHFAVMFVVRSEEVESYPEPNIS